MGRCLSLSDKMRQVWVLGGFTFLFFQQLGNTCWLEIALGPVLVGLKGRGSIRQSQTKKWTNCCFIVVVCCMLPGPVPATPASLWLFCTAECVPSKGGFLSYVHVGDRRWTGGYSAFCCVIASSPSVSLVLPLLLFLLLFLRAGLRGSADLGSVALLHQPLLVVCLAQDHVVLQEKLVSHTKPAPHKETEEEGWGFT